MKISEIRVSKKFERQYKKLPGHIKSIAKECETIFRNNTSDPRLKTHKLHGKDRELWAFWIDRYYRIKFVFLGDGAVLFLEVGTHDIYE